MKKLLKRLQRVWKWYVKGYYHCDHCPYCWSEYSYEGDGDCGCYIRGELWDTCRLIPPIRFLIGWPRMKRAQYWEGHQYDGIEEFYEQNDKELDAYSESVKILLEGIELCRRDCDGKLIPVCKMDIFDRFGPNSFYTAHEHYESKAHPVVHIPIKQQWKDLLRKTWNKFADKFRPYFS